MKKDKQKKSFFYSFFAQNLHKNPRKNAEETVNSGDAIQGPKNVVDFAIIRIKESKLKVKVV
jgi:hypothetical protein